VSDRDRLSGLWAFPLTPFDRDGDIDLRTLGDLVERQVSGGVDAIVSLGVIAEVESLSPDEWLELAVRIGSLVDARRPHLVTLPPGRAAALAAVDHAPAARADAVVYVPFATDVEALPATLSELGNRARVPVIVYQRGQVRLPIPLLERAVDTGWLVGLKDGTFDVRHYRRIAGALHDRLVLAVAWEDAVLAYAPYGVDAFCPASNAHDPAYSRAWYERLRAGDVDGARALLEAFGHPFSDLRLERPGIDVDVVKEVLRARGLDAGGVRAPGVAATAGERARARALLDQLDAALSAAPAG
jgi:5-dehydro-4-deoxyglucarate dehydratase